jgi:hypothetical protein
VILELGANDGLRGLPPERTRENLAQIIERLQAAGATVVLAGMRVPPNYGDDYAAAFATIFPDLARRYGLALIPFFLEGVATNPALNQGDGIHQRRRISGDRGSHLADHPPGPRPPLTPEPSVLALTDLRPLTTHLIEIAHLHSAAALLSWDQETYMPRGGAATRAETLAALQGTAHDRFISSTTEDLLARWIDLETGAMFDPEPQPAARALLREVFRDYRRAKRLPTAFVSLLEKTCALAQEAWLEARDARQFSRFLPFLEQVVTLKREEAALLGYSDTPYDALLDVFEPGMTTARVATLFPTSGAARRCSAALRRLGQIERCRRAVRSRRQIRFGRLVLDAMVRLYRGRLDQSATASPPAFIPPTSASRPASRPTT